MEGITAYTAQQVKPVEEITESLMQRFIDYTDREPTTTKGYLNCLRQFAKWLQENNIAQPTRADIMAYRDYLNGETFGRSGHETLKAGTKQQYLRAVKHFFRWTQSENIYPNIADNIHGAKVRNDVPKRDAFSQQELDMIADSIDTSTIQGKRLLAMVYLGGRRGLRVVEMSRASIKDLEEKGGVMTLNIWGKGHAEPDDRKQLDDDTATAIRDYLQARGKYTLTDPLFVSTSNNSKGSRIAPTTISTMIKKALIAAGFDSPRLTAHSLRHTAATVALECADGDIYAAQRFCRHVDPATTEKYLHVSEEKQDSKLVIEIQNSYHDDSNTTDLRQDCHDLLNELSTDELTEMRNQLHELLAARKVAV